MSKRPGCRVLDRKVRQNKPASQPHKENKDSEANFDREKQKGLQQLLFNAFHIHFFGNINGIFSVLCGI